MSLTKDLISLIKTGVISEKQVFDTDRIVEAINGKNYELALSLSSKHIREHNIDANSDAMYLLLTEIQSLIDKKNASSVAKKQVQERKPVKVEQSIGKVQMDQSNNKYYGDYEFVNQKLDKVYKKGILLLKPMSSERRKGIHIIVKNIPDVVSFSIGSDSSRRIVLRFRPHISEDVNLEELLRKGNEAYKHGDYDACISAYRQLLELREPKTFVYARLGLAYMKKFDKETAIAYLTVATELSKHEDERFDFTELIANLNGLISEENKKPHVKMSTSDFRNDMDEHYGIKWAEKVAELVSSGMTIDEACLNIGLNEEQKSIISLIFARECYAQENYTMGDQFLKKVERTKNKSKFTKSLFEEVRKNKIFYKNRADESQKRLVLTKKTNNNN